VWKEEIAGITYPVRYEYDGRGRLQYVKQGTQGTDERIYQLVYDPASGLLTSIIDPTGAPTGLGHDAAGRVTSQTQAGLVTSFPRDANGNLRWVAPPDRPAHAFSDDPVDLVSTYTPPAVAGVANPATSYGYNADHQLTSLTRPDGALNLSYEAANTDRLWQVGLRRGLVTLGYDPNTGALASVAVAGGVALGVEQDGPLPLSETWGELVADQTFSVSRGYDALLRPTPLTVTDGLDATYPVTLKYDNDGLLTCAIPGQSDVCDSNALSLTRDPNSGRVTATTLGGVGTSHRIDSFGAVSGMTATYPGSGTYDFTISTRDKLGRILTRSETIQGVTTSYAYEYYPAGWLKKVTVNGLSTTSYDYDDNGNRIAVTVDGNTTDCATGYDNQDRLLSCGSVTYTYTDNGELATKYNGSDRWTYTYDSDGALLSAVRTGTNPLQIDYVVDGRGRRVGRQVGGVLQQIFVYRDGLRPVAELYPSGALRSLFVYGAGGNVPAYMMQDGVAYRFITDHLGSVRLVVKVADGSVAQRLDYDVFGVVTSDTAPGFQPFGFAGGLYDPDTGLVRFGARDYDAATGRWTAKDPIGFGGGDTNQYGYVFGDPVNFLDPSGLRTVIVFWEPVGWGSSSFGHVSVDINGTSYSQAPGGMQIMPTDDYMQRNDFRSGIGLEIPLDSVSEAMLETNLRYGGGNYSWSSRNCATVPLAQLKRSGANIGLPIGVGPVSPLELEDALLDSGRVSDIEYYPATKSRGGSRAPWASAIAGMMGF
jgi:RHS repeat-associated protein